MTVVDAHALNFIGIGHSHIVALAKGSYALEAKGARTANMARPR